MDQLIFFTLSVLTLLSALIVVFAKSPMYSVLSLIVCFFTIAGHYILLNAQFLAITHIIVYAGAIMVLFLFVVMLLNLNKESEQHKSPKLRIAATISAGMLFLTLLASLKSTQLVSFIAPPPSDNGMVEHVGQKLFTDYLLPFEISSILFLSAMIGAVVLAKRDKKR
ncbi:MAG: NADH-quinone oxidoreductase subunit J [Bacteroidota bacterium]|nr:NADH-quinone oxidoreductase subunit J [Bacteroidota bacterium]